MPCGNALFIGSPYLKSLHPSFLCIAAGVAVASVKLLRPPGFI
jgi:hypothetical protein